MAEKKRKKKKKMNKQKLALLLSLLGIVAAVGIGFGIFAFFGRGSVTIGGAIRGYFKAIEAEDVDRYIRLCYPSVWSDNYQPRGEDVDLSLLVEAVFARQSGTKVEEVTIEREEKLEDVFVRRIESKVKEIYNVNLSLSAVYRVYFTLKVSYISNGEEVTYTGEPISRYIYKYKGKWYYLADALLLVDMDIEE